MTHVIVATPGNGMRNDGCPRVVINSSGDSSTTVTVTYHAAELDAGARFVELAFVDVVEFRWIEWEVHYETHPQHEDDYEFALIEVLDSAYVRALRADSVRHFRMEVDDWGALNIIARGVQVRSIEKPGVSTGGEKA